MQLQLLKPFLRRRKAKPTSVCMKEGANEGKNVQGRTKPRNFTHPEEPMVSRLSVLSWGKSPDPGVASLEPRFHHPLLVQASFPGGHPQTPGLASLEPPTSFARFVNGLFYSTPETRYKAPGEQNHSRKQETVHSLSLAFERKTSTEAQ